MKQALAYQKLQRFAKQNLASIKQNIIVKERDHFVAFDRFKIVKEDLAFTVYRHDEKVWDFINSQNALSYCIFHRIGRQEHAYQLEHLDKKLQQKMFNIEVARHTMKKTSDEDRAITAMIRAQEDVIESKNLKKQINHLVNLAKYFQEKELDNEVN